MPRSGTRTTLYAVSFFAICACAAALLHRQIDRRIETLIVSRVIFGEAPGRLEIPSLPHAMVAGETSQVPLILHGHRPRSAIVELSYYVPDIAGFQSDCDTNQTVLWRADGTPYVNVTPLRRGNVRINVTVIFADGRNDRVMTGAEVDLPERKPISFRARWPGEPYDGPRDKIAMDAARLGEYWVLQFEALYREGDPPVQIDANDVHFKVISAPDEAAPVAVVGGFIWPKTPGHALILSTYEGLTDWTCVTVTKQASNAEGSSCDELVPPVQKCRLLRRNRETRHD